MEMGFARAQMCAAFNAVEFSENVFVCVCVEMQEMYTAHTGTP